MRVNACSLSQLEAFGRTFPGAEVGVRFNPGLGSGGTGKTNVGGPDSSFGIWHEKIPAVQELVKKYKLKARATCSPPVTCQGLTAEQVVRIHTHIGSGSDPAVWQRTSGLSLDLCRHFPDVKTLNLGGGYKVARMSYEKVGGNRSGLSTARLTPPLRRARRWPLSARLFATHS